MGPLSDAQILEDAAQLAAEDGDVRGVLRIGPRGEEPDEPVLPHHLARGSKLLHAHQVHAGPTVHRGLGGRLAHGEDRAALQHLPLGRLQRLHGHGGLEAQRPIVIQHAKPGVRRHAHQPGGPLALAQLVAAVSQEDEAPVPEPPEEGLDLLRLLRLLPLVGARPGALRQLGHHRVHLADHGTEVRGGPDHILQPPLHFSAQHLETFGVGDLVHLAVDQGFGDTPVLLAVHRHRPTPFVPLHVEERVDDVLDGDALGMEELPEGVQDEGPVGDMGADHRDRRVPSVGLDVRVPHLHVHPVRPGPPQEPERREDQVRQCIHAPLMEELRGRLRQHRLGEVEDDPGLGGVESALQMPAHRVQGRRILAGPAAGGGV